MDKTINTKVPKKHIFALHFLQSLSTLTSQNSFDDSPDKTNDRVKKIKIAAYVSMAKAAGGSKWLWSRALLSQAAKGNNKIVGISRRKKKKATCQMMMRRRTGFGRRRRRKRAPVVEEATEKLRNLVPGGGGMETTSKLMEETVHYIKCLSIQVKVMQCLVDGMSPK